MADRHRNLYNISSDDSASYDGSSSSSDKRPIKKSVSFSLVEYSEPTEEQIANKNKRRRSASASNTGQNVLKPKKFVKIKNAKLYSRKYMSDARNGNTSRNTQAPLANLDEFDNPASRSNFSTSPLVVMESLSISHQNITPLHSNEPSTSSSDSSIPGDPLECENITESNSIERGKKTLEWLIKPNTVELFFGFYWERQPWLSKRGKTKYFSHLISFHSINDMLLKNHIEYGKNIDITSHTEGISESRNLEGRAMPPIVFRLFNSGCNICLFDVQTFLPDIHALCASMQEIFHCLVSANVYLTPPNCDDIAPHYDNNEKFVLQVEGCKRWRLYETYNKEEVLPTVSSSNLDENEIGRCVTDVILEPGDMLYFPRGTVHEAFTEENSHSLDITLSFYQKQSFGDLFEIMLPMMLKKVIASSVSLRRGLPLNIWQHTGIAYSDNCSNERAKFITQVTQLLTSCMEDLPLENIIDAAIDQMAKKFYSEALPPYILPAEENHTIFGSRGRINERGKWVCDYAIHEHTKVRLLRANILHMVEEEDGINFYFYSHNTKTFSQYTPNYGEISDITVASLKVLIKSYPQYVRVCQLPYPTDNAKIELATNLFENGLLMLEKPFR